MTMNRAKAAEDEYIANQEADNRRDRAWALQREEALAKQGERERIKAVQLRSCPKCHTALEIRTLRGVEIDGCRSCNGVWLDEGELERLTRPETSLLERLGRAFRSKD